LIETRAIRARDTVAVLIEHRGRRPQVHESAYVAPTAVLCGDVSVGAGARVLFNAVVTAEDGSVELGQRVVVMEHALVRGRAAHPVVIERDVLIGPHAHVNGVRIGAEAFIATGAALFPGATIGTRAEVRIQAVVHVNSTVTEGATVPIGWVVVGDRMLPPAYHADIWDIQQELDFPGTVYGEERGDDLMARVMRKQSAWLGAHRDDEIL
jgi:carbonic anhydrase/acetyltransferase-like protein (isoleucine patch superfamily)